MPVSESNCGRGQTRRHNNKFNGVRHDQVQAAGLVDGTVHCDNITYVNGPRTIYPTPAASHDRIRPRNRMNGYVNNGYRSNTHEMTPEYYIAKQPECRGSTSVNGSRNHQEPTKLDQSTTTKIQRKKRKPWLKKRNNHVACFEDCVPQPIEDWEGEIQETKICNWGEMSFGTEPYGPEDVVTFSLRNLSLEQSHPPLWQVTSNKYLPATHHRLPIEWSRYKPCSEPGQFSDVED